MPRNGSGSFSRVHDWTTDAANGLNIEASRMDADADDIANEITNSLAKDGQTPPTANLPMGNFRHTGVGTSSARTMYGQTGQIQDGAYQWGGTTGGSANAYTATLSPAPTAYATGMHIFVKIHAANTGASTINVNGLGVKSITKNGTTALASGDLPINSIAALLYDGTQFVCVGFLTGAVSAPIPLSIVDAKGDLIVATAADTVARKAVGTNGTFLAADSAQSDGVLWQTVNGYTEDLTPDKDNDYLLTYDASAGAHKKTLLKLVGPHAATDSDMEASTAGLFVQPSNIGRSHLVAKAWCAVTVSGGTPSLSGFGNVSSITDLGVGLFRINFSVTFSSAAYCPLVSVSGPTTDGRVIHWENRQTTSCDVRVLDSSADTAQDPLGFSFVVFGDLA